MQIIKRWETCSKPKFHHIPHIFGGEEQGWQGKIKANCIRS